MVEVLKNSVIRVQSDKDEWMNAIFLVKKEDEARAKDVLQKAVNDFWENGEGWCYENFLEAKMVEARIAFDSYYADVNICTEYL